MVSEPIIIKHLSIAVNEVENIFGFIKHLFDVNEICYSILATYHKHTWMQFNWLHIKHVLITVHVANPGSMFFFWVSVLKNNYISKMPASAQYQVPVQLCIGSSVKNLKFGCKFNQNVDELPTNLTHLTFGM